MLGGFKLFKDYIPTRVAASAASQTQLTCNQEQRRLLDYSSFQMHHLGK